MLETNKIYQGDCLELMKQIEDKSIDLILCDLPYGTTACKWDTIIPFEPLWEQYERIIRVNGYIVLFGSQPFTSELIHSNIENFSHQWVWNKLMSANPLLCKKMPLKNFEDICVFCFNYNKYDFRRSYFEKILNYIGKSKKQIIEETNQGLDHCFRIKSLQFDIPTKENYNILIQKYRINKMKGFVEYEELAKFKRVYNPQMIRLEKTRTIGGGVFGKDDFLGINHKTTKRVTDEAYPTSILEFSNRKEKSFHPTQKPVALFEYLIKTYTNEGDLVLDNCIGSGTTAIACIKTNRRFIGMELEQKYVDIANKRIGEVKQEAMQSEARNSSQP